MVKKPTQEFPNIAHGQLRLAIGPFKGLTGRPIDTPGEG